MIQLETIHSPGGLPMPEDIYPCQKYHLSENWHFGLKMGEDYSQGDISPHHLMQLILTSQLLAKLECPGAGYPKQCYGLAATGNH